MRIVSGKWAGKPLTSPGGRVRPTAEPLRDRMLTLVGADLAGARVLDLYAGTGALGLEALSRGARYADFVENHPSALHSLKANVAALRVREKTRIFKRDALRFAWRLPAGAYAVALADPPYTSLQGERLVQRWLEVPFSRVLVVEHAADRSLPGRGETHAIESSAFTIFRAPEPT